MDELRFDGRVAVITGSGRGIGRAHAKLLASRGAKVVVNDLGVNSDGTGSSSGPATDAVAEITAAGGIAVADTHSVATEEGAKALIATALDTFGRIDVLIHNAGFVFAELDALLDVHLRAATWMAEAAWETMTAQQYGRILLTTSNAGLYGFPTGTDYSPMQAYGSAKMGVVGLMRALALRGGPSNIHVNALAPGAETTISEGKRDGLQADQRIQELDASAMPSRSPDLVAAAAAWFVHEDCPATGQIFAAAAGTVTRVFVAETPGYVNPALTPELVRDHFDQICDENGYTVPTDLLECPHVKAMLGKAPAPTEQ